MYDSYKKALLDIKNDSLERKLSCVKKEGKYIFLEGKKYLNLSSNDYLGIAENKDVLKEFYKNSDYKMGSASSRLLTGNDEIYCELENFLAQKYKKEKALIFNSGYHANVGIMSGLLSKKDIVFSDKLNHASIIDGIRLSEASFHRYKHLDYEHLESLLEKHRGNFENAIIITESLFSMDGDIADLKKLVELKKKYNAILIIDEAHAFGVYGDDGLGICQKQNVVDDIDLIAATFGKAIGSIGAFCAGSGILIDYLINKSRPLIFSTALPEINIAYTYHILKNILPLFNKQRENLFEVCEKLSQKIKEHSLETYGNSYIIPVILGSNENALNCSKTLMNEGYYLLPIRHPTVPVNSACIRISMRADINYEDVEKIPQILSYSQCPIKAFL